MENWPGKRNLLGKGNQNKKWKTEMEKKRSQTNMPHTAPTT